MAKRYRYCVDQAIFVCRYCIEETRKGFALLNPQGDVEKEYKRRETAENQAKDRAGSCLEAVRKDASRNHSEPGGGKSRLTGLFAGSDTIKPFRWGE